MSKTDFPKTPIPVGFEHVQNEWPPRLYIPQHPSTGKGEFSDGTTFELAHGLEGQSIHVVVDDAEKKGAGTRYVLRYYDLVEAIEKHRRGVESDPRDVETVVREHHQEFGKLKAVATSAHAALTKLERVLDGKELQSDALAKSREVKAALDGWGCHP